MSEKLFDEAAFIASAKADEKARAFFQANEATEACIEMFLKSYATHKKRIIEKGNILTSSINLYKKKPVELAWMAYKLIYRRKIFIKQCLWRAKKIDLPEVDISFVFHHWGENPLHCPFIDPPTQTELELMKRFLTREDFAVWDVDDTVHGQEYDAYRNPPQDEEPDLWDAYPKWYAYCDEHLDELDWRDLPDLKGEKEALYLKAGKKKKTAPVTTSVPPARKKKIDYEEEEQMVLALAEHLGDEFTAQYLKDRQYVHSNEITIDVRNAIHYLQTPHGELIPMPADNDWFSAVKRSAEMHQARKAAELLDDIHEQYLYSKANDLLEPVDDYLEDVVEMFRENILAGRKKLGEPENFNY